MKRKPRISAPNMQLLAHHSDSLQILRRDTPPGPIKIVDRARWTGTGEDLVLTVPPAGARVVVCFPDSGQGSCGLRRRDVRAPGLSS